MIDVQVQKHVQIRMDAHQNYIKSLLEKACKIASEQITASASGPETAGNDDLADLVSMGTSSVSSSGFHQTTAASEGMTFYQKLPNLRHAN